MNNREKWDQKYKLKIKTITVTLTEKDQKYFMDKLGKLPNAPELKKIAMNNPITIIQKKEHKELKEILFQLKKIGNNINQIAYNRNTNFEINEAYLRKKVAEINELTLLISKNIRNEN